MVIVGPTGTGKSRTAIHVAERIGGEIVGCDAVQVYRGLDAATAKPSIADRQRVPHHLVDVADPKQPYTLADYVRDAESAIRTIVARGRIPFVVGGTGLYLRGLLRGIIPAPEPSPVVRRRLRAMASRHGSARLHRWLRTLDPDSAHRIAPGDTHRVIRALEFALGEDAPWSERLRREGTWAGGSERFDALKIGLDTRPEGLDARIAQRVDAFYDAGLVEEVRGLLAGGVQPDAKALKAIGYREVGAAIARGHDPVAVRDDIVKSTRRYSRRQRTWFRKEPGIAWLDSADDPGALVERIVEMWQLQRS